MGYYTQYALFVKEVNADTIDEIRDWLIAAKIANYALDPEYEYDGFGNIRFDNAGSAVKWYTHDADMKKLSKAFPTIPFLLRGNGEDIDDVWAMMFLDGNSEGHDLPIPKFDIGTW